eukprot:TRINITY_DN1876_c0_g1_i7.p1 TRINITY_DN1876_c0_g1~~TRINITY_DN1876_c0_g1_i7.p1  ORF type:complete len:254 (-),score=-24.26 TRINITY_DN1876_c0_g1_i7:139-900(-)
MTINFLFLGSVNVLRNAMGQQIDVLLLQEVARGCSQYEAGVNGAEVIARALQMYWVYFPEYILDQNDTPECSSGNAILSRFPLHNVSGLVFEKQCCRYDGRIGGRSAVHAQIQVAANHFLNIWSTHLESGTSSFSGITQALYTRALQVAELGKTARSIPAQFQVIGGDFNAPLRAADPTLMALSYYGFVDAHRYLSSSDRVTTDNKLSHFDVGLGTLDYLTSVGDVLRNASICNKMQCYGASDHYPIFAWLSV